MTEAQTALSRRAVACKGWRWMPGMLDDDGCTVCSASDDGYLLLAGSEDSVVGWWPVAERLPDLSDPATLGCLLALVREAWGCDSLSPLYNGAYGTDSWIIVGSWPACIPVGRNATTEAEALVLALEAAPTSG